MELSIGELAQRAGVTRRTIRYYVEIGLLPPPSGAGKAAIYGAEHFERLELIKELQGYRLSLEEIRDRLAGTAALPSDAMSSEAPASSDASASHYIRRLRESEPRVNPRQREGRAVFMQASMLGMSKPQTDYDAEQWLRIRLSEDVELHVRRRASRTHRGLNRLIKEARRILAEEEVELTSM